MKKILITQALPNEGHNIYADLEQRYGVTLDFKPLMHVEGISVREFRDQHIYLDNYTAIILNSRLGIDHFFHLCEELRFNVPETMHYYCISDAIGNYLQKYIQYRKRRVFAAENNRFETLLPAMNRRPDEKYLMVTSDSHNDDIINMFASHNIQIRPAVMYHTVVETWPKEEPFVYDLIVFSTPGAVSAIKQSFPDFQPGKTQLAGYGINTQQAIEEAGWKVGIAAPTSNLSSIKAVIEHYLNSNI